MTSGSIRLSFPARAEYLILGRLALAGAARAVPIPEETLADLKLAVTEACGNVVRHAYAGADGPVRLTIDAQPDAVTITVEDDGIGLPSVEAISDGDHDELGEGGMGLAIIKAIADELEVSDARPHGTVLRFRKRLPPGP